MKLVHLLLACFFALVATMDAWAIRAYNPEEEAKVIVTGMVKSISSEETAGGAKRLSRIGLVVAGVERGDGLQAGQALELWWSEDFKTQDPFGGDGGQFYIPTRGELVRVYLGAPTNNLYEVCYGMGIVSLASPATRDSPKFLSPLLIGGLMAAVGIGVGFVFGRRRG